MLSLVHFVLVVHKDGSLFKCSKFKILRRLRVQLKQLLELLSIKVHCACVVFSGKQLLFVDVDRGERLERNVALQVLQQLVVVENALRGQLHELGSLLIEHVHTARQNEHQFIRFAAILLNFLVRAVHSSIEPNDALVAEPHLARVEEMLEPAHELVEDLVNQCCLHLWRQLLIQVILFHNQVEIEVESICHSFLDLLAKLRV